jgi:hypothetical protein
VTAFLKWTPERLTSLLAGLAELIPWVHQWHNGPAPAFDAARMGDYFADFVQEETRELRLGPEQTRGWASPAGTAHH